MRVGCVEYRWHLAAVLATVFAELTSLKRDSFIHKKRNAVMTERHMVHTETLSNSCKIEVKARILRDGSLEMFIGVYQPNGAVIVEDHAPKPHLLDMEAAFDWGIEQARGIGNSQRTL